MKRSNGMVALGVGLGLLALLPGCLDEDVVRPTPLPIERLTPAGGASFSGLTDSLRVVVGDAATFAQWWTAAWPEEPLPDVDFGSHTVIVAAMGERSSSGFSIRVDEVLSEGYGLRVLVRTEVPGTSCSVATVMTQPTDFVSVAVRGKPVRFVEEREVTDCD